MSRYPPGSSLAALPFVAPFAVGPSPERDAPLRPSRMRRLGKLVAATYTAGAVALFALTCVALAPAAVVPATLLFAFGTPLWSTASQGLWMHGPAVFWLTLAGWLLFARWRPRQRGDSAWAIPALAGLALGLAFVTRPTTAFAAAAAVLALAAVRDLRAAAACALGAAVPVAGLVAWNAVAFGAPVAGGYGEEAARWTTPLWLGAAGLLVAPSRGLLVYSPALLLVPWGVRALGRADLRRSDRALLWAWSAAALASLLLYARWHMWWGGWSYGPRFLCEALPVLGWLFALACRDWGDWPAGRRRLVGGLVALSIAIHALGVFGHPNDWNGRNDDGRAMFSLTDGQIAAHARELARRVSGGDGS